MSKEVKINYNNTFATQHSRDYYRGASFHWSGEWMVGAHYLSDDYTIDYVVHGQVLLACAKSHLSTLDNEPKDFITDESGTVIGVVSTYWDFVLSGIVGKSPGIKIQDNYWYICKDTGVPEEQQVWENTGVKAKMELSDLTPEEIEILQEPGKEVVTEFINNTMTQETGQDSKKIMSQKATTDALNTKASKSELLAAVENEVLRANEAYQPKGDYATNTKVDNLQDEVDDFEDAVDEAFGTVSEALDTLQDNIDNVADSIPTKVSELENDSRYQTKTDLDNALNPIKDVIPAEATVGNKLADKNFVTVSIETAKAAFKGVSASSLTEEQFLAWANGLTTNENDYVFWNTVDSNNNAILKRYVRSDSSWVYEYTLSNNSFSTSEWNAIQSGITSELVSKLTNIEAGAQVNILEGVQVSGIDLAITNKKVNVDLTPITNVIPTQASSSNQLADKNFVNSSIATSTATFQGTSAAGLTQAQFEAWLETLTADDNDYVYWNTVDSVGNVVFKRYKYNGTAWVYEYDLNNSSFTSTEWAAIQSGVTAELVTKLVALPTNADLTAALNNKVDKVTGKQLSTEDYTTEEKTKLGRVTTILTGIQPDAETWTGPSPGEAVTHVYIYGINSETGALTTIDLVNYLVPKDSRTNYTAEEKQKLAGIATGAEVNVQSDWNVTDTSSDAFIKNKPENLVQDATYVHTDNNYTTTEKNKLSGIESNAQVNKIEHIQINGTEQTISNKTVNLPAYPTTLPASDVYAWAKASTKPSYNFSEINGTVADSQLPDTISSDITGTAMGLKTEKLTGQEFVYRATPNTIKAKSFSLDRIYGKTLAWNQLVPDSHRNFVSSITDTKSALQLQIQWFNGSSFINSLSINSSLGLQVILARAVTGSTNCRIKHNGTTTDIDVIAAIVLKVTSNHLLLFSYNIKEADPTTVGGIKIDDICVFDLTLLYGSEIDGLTDAEILAKFEADFGTGNHEYNAGTLISNDASALETVERNQWDEEWEFGAINSNGENITDNTKIRSKNFVPVFPNKNYFITIPSYANNCWINFYDSNKSFISRAFNSSQSGGILTPANCAYIRFYVWGASDVTTYNHDICINFSDSSKNGTYEPYRKSTMQLGLDSIKVKSHNIWDEEWEEGVYNDATGEKLELANRIRCKNPIPISPSTSYYFMCGVSGAALGVIWYDVNNQYISKVTATNSIAASPANARYVTFYVGSVNLTTYSNNICINLSSPFNGQYEPHGLLTLNGLGGREGWNDILAQNKLTVRRKRVNLGGLIWNFTNNVFYTTGITDHAYTPYGQGVLSNIVCERYVSVPPEAPTDKSICFTNDSVNLYIRDSAYNTASALKTSLEGVYMDYELATPIEYELVEPLVTTVMAGTTEARISPNADGLSAPFCADMTYSVADYTEYADRAGALVKGASVDLTDITASGELSGNAFKVIAEHIAKLTSRVEALEAGVGTVDTLSSTSVDSANGYYINGDKTVIIGSGAPTMVPAFAGQFYINTSGPALYYAVNNSATTDWKQA